jgi:hypothetical protein
MATQLVEHLKDNRTAVRAEDIVLNYKKKGQKPVKLLLKKSQQEKITELNLNVLMYLFSIQPEPAVVAENIVGYISDLPNELRHALMMQFKPYADENNAAAYLRTLMRDLQQYRAWTDAHCEMHESLTSVDKGLEI